MSEILGKNIICDRCGKTHFLQYIKTNSFDGGYTKADEFEKMPEGWKHHYDPIGLLCDECEKEYSDFINEFINKYMDRGKV